MIQTKAISKSAKKLGGIIRNNSPTILTSLAVGGLITTVIFAVKATPKAFQLLEKELENQNWVVGYDENGKLCHEFTKLEIIKLTWKCYIPTAAIGMATIACIVGANHISLRRNAALVSVYSITEAALKEYQAKVVETIGRNKEQKVRDEVSGDRIRQNPPGANEIIFTGKGDFLCYDSLSGRYFKSDIEQIRRSVNALNKEFLSDMFLSLNDLYYALGLAGIELGHEMGWHLDKGLLEILFSTNLTEDGEPCLVLNYAVAPRYM